MKRRLVDEVACGPILATFQKPLTKTVWIVNCLIRCVYLHCEITDTIPDFTSSSKGSLKIGNMYTAQGDTVW